MYYVLVRRIKIRNYTLASITELYKTTVEGAQKQLVDTTIKIPQITRLSSKMTNAQRTTKCK